MFGNWRVKSIICGACPNHCRESCLQQLPWHLCWLHYPGSPLVLMGNNDSTELSLNCCWNVSCMHGHVLLLTLRGRLVLDAKLLNTKTSFIIGLQKQNPANSNKLSPVRTKAKQLPTYCISKWEVIHY